jgi:hypothetical protein
LQLCHQAEASTSGTTFTKLKGENMIQNTREIALTGTVLLGEVVNANL